LLDKETIDAFAPKTGVPAEPKNRCVKDRQDAAGEGEGRGKSRAFPVKKRTVRDQERTVRGDEYCIPGEEYIDRSHV
jgi:hypothetical protein